MKNIYIFVVILIAVCVACDSSQQERNSPPNIVYILADDLGYGELGAYGQQKIETPNIDQLAQNGMLFSQHYAGSPVCAPSRYMLMTGKHPGHAYIRGNDEWGERGDVWSIQAMRDDPELEGQRPIPDSTVTVAEVLKKGGYQTAAIGKWGLGAPKTEGHPNEQGFDFFYGYIGQRQAHNYYPDHLWRNHERIFLDNIVQTPHATLPDSLDPRDTNSYAKYHDQPDYAPDLMQEEVLSFVDRSAQKDQPFFLYYATPIPHAALQAPQRWIEYYHEKFGDEEPYLGGAGYLPVRYPKATYAAMISYLDEQVGQLVQKLKEKNEYDDTLIIFTSDNGPTYNGGTYSEFFNSAGPFQEKYGRGKGFVYEGGIRVPMIASWPDVVKPGSKTNHLSAFWDVLPTLSEIAGQDVPASIDGISFAPTLKGLPEKQEVHNHLYWEFPAYGGQQAVRMGKWKAVRRDIKKEKNLDIELYNLEEDPTEEQDIANQYPDVVETIRQIMEEEHTSPKLKTFGMKALGDE
ncbi:arylsulfatase [Fodinibius salsisoli]|uniref:Arylsulfatase n=1 Tax=Fodinibius salsisoli TaxID=2820877 RepID=A0ABT3PQ52_9BACT|nr:arylsulfatase [Fodinibius salsisoli]MCW9707995.1 arylsulfatase [Fodinibius salsisoli]